MQSNKPSIQQKSPSRARAVAGNWGDIAGGASGCVHWRLVSPQNGGCAADFTGAYRTSRKKRGYTPQNGGCAVRY